MSDWPILTLGEVCEKITDGAHNSPKSVDDGKPMASVKDLTRFGVNLSGARLISQEDFEKLVKQGCQPEVGDVLIAKDGNSALDTVCTIDKPLDAVMLSSVAILRPNKEKLDSDFLKYYFCSKDVIDYLKSNFISGAAIPRVVLKDFRKAEIKTPPIEKQKKISRVLRSLDNKIELNRQTNQTLEQIAQAIFKSWFVDFEPTRAKIKAKEIWLAAHQNVELSSPTCYAEQFDNQHNISLQETMNRAAMAAISGAVQGCTNIAGSTKPGATKTEAELNNLPADTLQQLRTIAELFPDTLVESELGEIPAGWEIKKINDVVKRLKPKKRYKKNEVKPFGETPVFEQGADILLGYHNNKAGFLASPENPLFIFGDHTCIIHLSCEDFDISQNVVPLSGNGYPTIWVYYAIQGKQAFQEYRRHWSEFVIKDLVTPCIEISEEYAKFTTSLYKQKEQLVKENKILEQIRDTLLPKLLSGELSLADTGNQTVP